MPYARIVGKYLRLIAVVVLSTATPTVFGADEQSSAEKDLKRVVGELSKCAEKVELPPILSAPPAKDNKTVKEYGIIRVARMTSDTTAKITLSFYWINQKGETVGAAMLSLYLSWHKGMWTVTKHEIATFVNFYNENMFIPFTTVVDEIGAKP